jgi:creatinine amidohydrolase
MDWDLLSAHDHARLRYREALLPIGTIEAHDGGPVGTDNLIPAALCRRLAPRLEIPVLPVMPYGITKSLRAYPGSCSLAPATLEAFLYDLGVSLAENGLRRLFIINGHGGNTAALRTAAGRLFAERGLQAAVIDWWWEAGEEAKAIFGPGGMGHAAIDEMGVLLGLVPEMRERLPLEPVPAYYVFKGVQAYPSPRPVMTYDHPDDPVDFSRLEPQKCARFAEYVTDLVERMIREIREGWDALDNARGEGRP